MSVQDGIFTGLMISALQYSVLFRAVAGALAGGILGGLLFVVVPYLWNKSESKEQRPSGSTGIILKQSEGNVFRLKRGVHGYDTAVDVQGGKNNVFDAPGGFSRGPMPAGQDIDAHATIPPVIDPDLTQLSIFELRARVDAWASAARDFENPFLEKSKELISSLKPFSYEKYKTGMSEFYSEFAAQLRQPGLALRNELLRRLGRPLTYNFQSETLILEGPSPLAGLTPVTNVATKLQDLSRRLS